MISISKLSHPRVFLGLFLNNTIILYMCHFQRFGMFFLHIQLFNYWYQRVLNARMPRKFNSIFVFFPILCCLNLCSKYMTYFKIFNSECCRVKLFCAEIKYMHSYEHIMYLKHGRNILSPAQNIHCYILRDSKTETKITIWLYYKINVLTSTCTPVTSNTCTSGDSPGRNL